MNPQSSVRVYIRFYKTSNPLNVMAFVRPILCVDHTNEKIIKLACNVYVYIYIKYEYIIYFTLLVIYLIMGFGRKSGLDFQSRVLEIGTQFPEIHNPWLYFFYLTGNLFDHEKVS